MYAASGNIIVHSNKHLGKFPSKKGERVKKSCKEYICLTEKAYGTTEIHKRYFKK